MRTLTEIWPLFGIRLRTPRLELRLLTEAELVDLVELAASGIHDPETMPFGVPWTDLPPGEFEREALKFHWARRAEWSPAVWSLQFGVFAHGVLVGSQDIAAKDFGVVRTVDTGSWLGRDHQGKGMGKEMRAAVLAFAFGGLGADLAMSGAWHDNPASQGVSLALGYEPDGWFLMERRGEAVRHERFRLTREAWDANRFCDVEIEGVEACRTLLGAD